MNNYKFYLELSEEESIECASKAIQESNDMQELEDILLHLALFTNGKCLKPHYFTLINKKVFYPSEIYIHADEQIADELIKIIEKNTENTNHLLCCLAWIGTSNVIDFLTAPSIEKLDWSKKLYILPREYTYQAGWFIDENNLKKSLIQKNISVFTRQEFGEEKEIQTKTFVDENEVCKFCENHLSTVFRTEIDSTQVPFTTCLLCSAYEPFFMIVGNEGNSSWHNTNKRWEHFDEYDLKIEKIKENTLIITDETRKPEFTISQFVEISKSQIGGYPTWIQDGDYLNCPDCKEKMQYIGQVDMEDVEDFNEGIYYFHYCKRCKITGTNYQQT